MSKGLWRTSVTQLKPYIPGKAIEDVKRELGLEEIIRLASNENPLGPSPKAVQAMQVALQDSQLYPEATCRELREKLGNLYGIDSNQFLVTNGADNAITLIGTAYINPGDEIIYCTPTFPAYRTITLLMGGIPVEVPITREYTYDLDAILTSINENTKLIFICNPNNPTGTIVEDDKLKSFLQLVPPHVVVVLDEAYAEFINSEGYRTGVDYVKEGFPVIFVRTFSKLYGLAATRIGYAAASLEYIRPVQSVREPFAANRIAQAGAIAALDDVEYKNITLQENKHEMVKLTKELQAFGYHITESHANFLFVDMKEDSIQFSQALMQEGILIRPCAAWGLQTHARITIGTAEQNERLIKAVRKISEKQTTT
ncbi:histidinol-phosphate transaminase [Bacillus sp. FJAT-29790]|uniref:histidinol-phosphate transaminase n=1 Tax=Bacillus sp. FJAT-29790 TaxID=1895002 RepID=UPI001C247EB3|nr:histidinol-phosphate transaminase [Bacillus sp. FJAT-29790]MBU8879714.1 histidinol-phosphate transaminase [Bacillus sp. FJAT-29790]